jgi:uncharacterized protein (DUF58 family)
LVNFQQHIENIDLLAKQVVEGFIIGLHKSPFHGFSVEFAEHRIYNQGDNLKHIDWKVFGRTDKLFIKKFEEETNLRCQIIIDTSSSMYFPENPVHYNKLQFSCIAAAAISKLLKKQLDASGLTFFDTNAYFHTTAKSNQVHHTMMMNELQKKTSTEPSNKTTNAANVLHQIAETIHKRSLVILFSDMLDKASEQDEIFDALQHLKYKKHEVILFHVQDGKYEVDFDFENRPYEFIDLETGDKIRMNNMQLKQEYVKQMGDFRKNLQLKCAQYKVDIIDADINKGFDQILLPYLIKRNTML